MSFEVVSLSLPEVPADILKSLANLTFETWPQYISSADDQLTKLLASQREYTDELNAIYYFLLDGSKSVIAHSHSFKRTMFASVGEIDVMALGGVCVTLAMRGKGLGAEVVKAAFQRVDNGTFPVSVYQTPLVRFYEKLGAGVCESNTWVDKQDETAPKAHPWQAGETIMHYPSSFDWPVGEIDINGGRY